MSRANGCGASVESWWLWSVVLAVALAVAGLAARMLARSAPPPWRTDVGPASTRNRPPAGRVFDVEAFDAPADVARSTWSPPPNSPRTDPSLAILAWLAAIGWVTFNGSRPQRWPWWDARRAAVWAATFTSAMPEALR
ncbi:MAG: hypothetical protein JWM10_2562 [Myxococcaceae bacterium]|nr:hypothetical protein [Myxococcaceae bacterium]